MKELSNRGFLVLAYLAYACVYVGRLNLTIATPALEDAAILDAAQIGAMGGAFFLCYALGQLANGFLGDLLPPRRMVTAGLFFAALGNLGIALLPPAGMIFVLWGANGVAQSMLWGPLLRMLALRYPGEAKTRMASWFSTSVGVGSILGIFLASAAVALWDVRAAFWLPGVLTAVACGVVAWRFPDLPAASRAPKGRQLLRDLRAQCAVLRQRTLWVLMAVAALHGVIKDNLNLWVAAYFADTYALDLAALSFYVFFIPLLTLAGRMVFPFLLRCFHDDEHRVSLLAFLVVAACLCVLASGRGGMGTALAALSLIAAAISMINASLLSIYPTRFDHCGCVSTVVGLMDFMTYLGAGVSSVVYGRLLAHIGYAGMFRSWLVIALLALTLTALARRLGEK